VSRSASETVKVESAGLWSRTPCAERHARGAARQQGATSARDTSPPLYQVSPRPSRQEQSVRSYRLERPAGSHVSNTSWTQVPEKPRPVPTSGAPGGRSQDHTSPVVVIPNTTQRVDPSTMSSGGIEVVEGNTYNTRQLAIKAFADGVTSSLSCKSNPRAQMPGHSAARHRLPSSPSTKRRRLGVP
jgi:hypothetical protein